MPKVKTISNNSFKAFLRILRRFLRTPDIVKGLYLLPLCPQENVGPVQETGFLVLVEYITVTNKISIEDIARNCPISVVICF